MRSGVALLVMVSLSGCEPTPYVPVIPKAVPKTDTKKQGDEDDIREVAFRQMLQKEAAGETCYISFDEPDIEGWIDPPEDFLGRLRSPQLKIRKVSEARHPRPDERDPKNSNRYQCIRDPGTGKPSSVYYVRVEWVSPDEAKATAGFTQGPLSGGSTTWKVVREKGAWVLKERLRDGVH
jgi:hypothetical protein